MRSTNIVYRWTDNGYVVGLAGFAAAYGATLRRESVPGIVEHLPQHDEGLKMGPDVARPHLQSYHVTRNSA